MLFGMTITNAHPAAARDIISTKFISLLPSLAISSSEFLPSVPQMQHMEPKFWTPSSDHQTIDFQTTKVSSTKVSSVPFLSQ